MRNDISGYCMTGARGRRVGAGVALMRAGYAACGSTAAGATTGIKGGVTEAIVGGAFLFVAEHFVSFAEFFEFLFSGFIAGIFVGVKFNGELAIRLF